MTDEERGGFLQRWSRRKTEARQEGQALDDASPLQEEPTAERADGAPSPAEPVIPLEAARSNLDAQPADTAPAPLTLQDVQALTRNSDFAPFISRQVAPEIKNAALKKLFSDPHYNVMDGLDIYIDDYSNLEPLPAPMLRRMASAQALKLFDALTEEGDTPRAEVPAAEAGGEQDEGVRTQALVESRPPLESASLSESDRSTSNIADSNPAPPRR